MVTSNELYSVVQWPNQGVVDKSTFDQLLEQLQVHFRIEKTRRQGKTTYSGMEWEEVKYYIAGELIAEYKWFGAHHNRPEPREEYRVSHGAVEAMEAIEALPDIQQLVDKAMELWDELGSDAYVDHRPWYKSLTGYVLKLKSYLSTTAMFKSILTKRELERHGFRKIWYKRFRGGDHLFVRERLDGTVIVKNLEGWAVGYLIGKGGSRAKQLGIRVVVLEG